MSYKDMRYRPAVVESLRIDDLRFPPSNHLEPLKGDRKGQWRICFRFSNGDAFDVEIIDYH